MSRIESGNVETQNCQHLLMQIQADLSSGLRETRSGDRMARRHDLEYLEATFGRMSDNHESKSWKHTISLVFAVIGIFGAAYDKDDSMRKILEGVSQAGQQFGQWTLTFNDAEMSRLNGHLEQLRDMVQQDNKDSQEIERLLQQIDQIVDQAIRRNDDARKSPYQGG